jgi:hypothetical protein
LQERKSIVRRLNGRDIMSALEQFLKENPDMAEKPYGDALAPTLSRVFPCQVQSAGLNGPHTPEHDYPFIEIDVIHD